MPAVIKQEHIAVGEEMRVVLVTEFPSAPLPGEGTAVALNNRHGIEETKAGEQVAIGQDFTGIGVRPLQASVGATGTNGAAWAVTVPGAAFRFFGLRPAGLSCARSSSRARVGSRWSSGTVAR